MTTVKTLQLLQPPQLKSGAYLRDELARLLTQAANQQAAIIADASACTAQQTRQERLQCDYGVLLRRWYLSIPPASRQRRYTTTELLLIFEGRYRDRPALRLIAAALRENGWTEHRCWRKVGRNRRYWQPSPDE